MELKDKLIKIIMDTYEISAENYYDAWTGCVEYTATKLNVEEIADAIIKSGLIKE